MPSCEVSLHCLVMEDFMLEFAGNPRTAPASGESAWCNGRKPLALKRLLAHAQPSAWQVDKAPKDHQRSQTPRGLMREGPPQTRLSPQGWCRQAASLDNLLVLCHPATDIASAIPVTILFAASTSAAAWRYSGESNAYPGLSTFSCQACQGPA